MMKRTRGFTLLELMIVVAVVAILATVALSAYNKQVRKSRRAEAMQALSDVSLRQEKWRSTHTLYLGANSSAGNITTFGAIPTSSYYNISITTNESATAYTVAAVPKAGSDQTKDSCGTLSIESVNGVVTKKPTTGNCW